MSGSVLCAIDISSPNVEKRVLEAAHQMAELRGATLDVVTVVPDFGQSIVGSFFNADHHDKSIKAAKEALNEQVESALGKEVNAKVRHVVATGTAYEEILSVAAKAKSELIVIGAHKPDFKDYLLGPNAARVVRHSDASVFVVR